MLIVIPTKDRPKELRNTLNFLSLNIFFFKKVVVVDSSNLKNKNVIKKEINNYNFDISVVDSKPSTCIQRNIGFNFLKDHEFIMFLDDDNIFYPDAFSKMQQFLNNNNEFAGVAFNQIYYDKKNILEKIKRNIFFSNFGIYNYKNGEFSKSGWQSKFINFNEDTIVQWLPTRAVIYKSNLIKNIRFDENFGIYGYLEDLDFSLELKKRGNLMVCSRAKYTHDQTIIRSGFAFGKKEIKNRYYIVKKHNLSKTLFFLTSFLRAILTFKNFIFGDLNSGKRLLGNLVGLINLNKLDKKI